MSSDNPIGADNQQETEATAQPLDPWWIAGFVDGEGCFSVSIHRNDRYARRTGGWQRQRSRFTNMSPSRESSKGLQPHSAAGRCTTRARTAR